MTRTNGSAIVSDDERGSTLVEFAVTLWAFAILVFSLIILVWIAWTSMTLNFAVAKAARWGAIGGTMVDPQTMLPLNRLDSFILRFETEARRFGVDPSDVDLTICPVANPNCTTNTVGNPGSMVVVTARKPAVPLIGALIQITPSCSVMMLNE